MLAVGGIFLVDALDNTVNDPEELKRSQGLNLLGMIPQHESEDGKIITVAQPRHPAAEAYRSLRTNLKYTSVDDPIQKIMITSSEPSVGKTSVVSNLAVVFAQDDSKVVLVDCDLRKPKIHRRLNESNHLGLSEYFLQEKITLKELIQPFPEIENLALITAGKLPPNPTELLGSKKMAKLLDDLTREFDYVLLDSPPLLAVTDAAVLSRQTDGVLLVVKPGQTKRDALSVAVEQLKHVQANILGLVMNEIPRRKSRYFHQGYQYYTYEVYQPEEK
jgi:capsular exopolysaccharide synthesis family protein